MLAVHTHVSGIQNEAARASRRPSFGENQMLGVRRGRIRKNGRSASRTTRAQRKEFRFGWILLIDFGAGRGYYVQGPLRATFVDPILGSATPVYEYEPGTWGPQEADRLLDPGDRWRAPAAIEAPA